ncbi:putative cytochrome P450 [Rhodococcus wratislaviensis NBRC 100605]|uniref:Putative cytochrome P450 n=2 Tax=Rhodococcus wratislaviensis TaxID=44752 RepID=X0PZ75_RHOWR|nr:cytochrome P450 [Rhodococcus wratislaviensis]GAF43782.1 putative cytochrome P450 [Rhodococcus wratislaviensis NBRC 100605]
MSNSAMISPGTRAFWERSHIGRLALFEGLRARPAIVFHTEAAGPGFWSVVGYDHVVAVSRNPEVFSSAKGFTIDDVPVEILEFAMSMIAMDNPRHRELRSLVQSAFTAASVRGVADRIRRDAAQIAADVPQNAVFDFVSQVANRLPVQVICELLGIPESDRSTIVHLAGDVISGGGQEFATAPGGAAGLGQIYGYAMELGERRKADPGDDLTSRLTATVDGRSLTPAEFGSFVILLITAGFETTRQALAWALHLLSAHPDQMQLLQTDFAGHIEGTIDEVIRYASPVPYMRRTATVDTDLGGAHIRTGDKVVMWYLSANHDESVFADPGRFDITRPNAGKHLGFGAKDIHHCLGVNLARAELRVMLEELLTAHPGICAVGEPELLLSAFVSGIGALPAHT